MKAIFSDKLRNLLKEDPYLLGKILEADRDCGEIFTTSCSKKTIKVNRIIETGGYRVGIVSGE